MNYDAEGPFIQLAALCEQVIEGKDGTLSLIRVIDTWTSIAVGADAPEQLPPFELHATFILALKAGAARGRYSYNVEHDAPSGKRTPLATVDVTFRGGASEGINILSPLKLEIAEEGLHWLNIVKQIPGMPATDQLVSRVPLQILYQRSL